MAHFHSYVSKYRDDEDTEEDETNLEPDTTKSNHIKDTKSHQDCFPCPNCERRFTCKQGLERHMHTHNTSKFNSKKRSADGAGLVQQPDTSSPASTGTSEGHYPCKYCTKIFNSHINRQRHERRFHEQQLQVEGTQEENARIIINTASQQEVQLETVQAEQYLLDISSNISENLSFYIDRKILSASTVHESAEVHSKSSALVSLDALILDSSQVVNTESSDLSNQAKRRTISPPLLPQIKTELQSEVVVASSSIIENILSSNTEQKEQTVFLSAELKEFIGKQDGLNPTLALITDGQKPGSPVSISVVPASARFKRRTGPPQHNSNEETQDGMESEVNLEPMEIQTDSQQAANEKDEPAPSAEEPVVKKGTERWLPVIGGNSCNQQPLDLSNAVRGNEDALDLSLQKKSMEDSEGAPNIASQNENVCEYKSINDQNIAPLVTDFAIVTGSDIVTPVDQVTGGLVYGLALPTSGLTPSSTSLTPVTLQPASPCTIAFTSPSPHTVLPTSPSLITVLASPPLPVSSNQPIQVLAPNLSPEPLVICTDNGLNTSDLTTAITTNSANLVALSQPLDSALNLPGHVFLTDPISLNPPVVEPTSVTLNDSLLNSYNITSNTVLIECTISLEAPGNVVPAAITLQENPTEPPAPAQMLVNHIEQQRILSVPNPQTVEPTILMSESVMRSTSTSMISDSPAGPLQATPEPHVVNSESTITKEEVADKSISSQSSSDKSHSEKPKEEDSLSSAADDAPEQTFTKNFICNVCDKLFHSMKELGQHVAEHADEWPYKCEFCLLLFEKPPSLLEHRSSLHGVGKTYVCSACTKEFVYLCNLKQHQEELHPGQQCTHTEEEKGKLRVQNYNNTVKDNNNEPLKTNVVKKEEGEANAAAEELFTTIKIMASDGVKGPDVRLGINQHYPSFKPPPFPYHNRSPVGSLASATNFTTHNIPQTFSTAIRCTKCGKSFDNMPELHKHILVCANASDKRRYTPKKNPVPLRHFAKSQNGVLSTTNSGNGLNTSNRSKLNQETHVKMKLKRKKRFIQRTLPQRNKSVPSSNQLSSAQMVQSQDVFVCPHCSREFTMRRSRTKHMAVCPKKPNEVKKQKDGGESVTNENDGHRLRRVSHDHVKHQPSPHHKTRLQTGSVKRPAVLPGQTVFLSKRSKLIIKESRDPKQETMNELPIVRTFNPAMRQYSRVHHSIKEIPIKITIVKPQPVEAQKSEMPRVPGQDNLTRALPSTEQRAEV